LLIEINCLSLSN